MKITKQFAAMIAALAMCMTTVSTSVSAKVRSLSDEGDYGENLTEEIVTEEENPVDEEIHEEEEAVPAEVMPEEAVFQEEMLEEEPDVKEPDTIIEGIPVYFEREGEGNIYAHGEMSRMGNCINITVIAEAEKGYAFVPGSLKPSSGGDSYKYEKNNLSIMYVTRYNVGNKSPIVIHAKFEFIGTFYPITIQQNENHGKPTIIVDCVQASKAYAGQSVCINTLETELGYRVSDFRVITAGGMNVPVLITRQYMYEFKMPNDAVTVNITYSETPVYNINVTAGKNIVDYYVSVGKNKVTQAAEGDRVYIACTEDKEYWSKAGIKAFNAETGDPLERDNDYYIMPAVDINVSIGIPHSINLIQDDNLESVKFIISGSEGTEALLGEKVKVIAKAWNYDIGTIIVRDENGNKLEVDQVNGTFTMPDSDVTADVKPIIPYVDENNEEYTCKDYTYISRIQEGMGYGLSNGWYVVDKDITFNEHRMTIVGDVNLILVDGATLTVNRGIRVGRKYNNGNNSLTIWSQKEGTGAIKCDALSKNAGIGGNDDESCGTVNIHGGNIEARGYFYAAGIGGGDDGHGGTIRIYGGKITAKGYHGGAGIGGGEDGDSGDILIYGGDIFAKADAFLGIPKEWGAGIGSGDSGKVNSIHIHGGNIETHGYRAVGHGLAGKDGTIVLGDNIEIDGFAWNDRYNVLSYGQDLILRAR